MTFLCRFFELRMCYCMTPSTALAYPLNSVGQRWRELQHVTCYRGPTRSCRRFLEQRTLPLIANVLVAIKNRLYNTVVYMLQLSRSCLVFLVFNGQRFVQENNLHVAGRLHHPCPMDHRRSAHNSPACS